MKYSLTPDTPRRFDAVHGGVAPGDDARWRDAEALSRFFVSLPEEGQKPKITQVADRTRVHEVTAR